jgi:regulator of protease activity HflC (stomatin/prohibitin superfamily)
MTAAVVVIVVVAVLLLLWALLGIRVIQQYEQGVVFRLGRVRPGVRQAGLTGIIPIVERLVKVNMQIGTMSVPAQEGITRDNVTVTVDAVVFYRVIDPIKAVVNVQNYLFAVSQISQTSLRSTIGKTSLQDLLQEREQVSAELQLIIDGPTEGPWGVKIERVEIKDVALPESLKRSLSRQAEAERERQARIITADGELQASQKLADAAAALAENPAGLQLRLLQTVVEVSAEKNSTLVMPIPVELLRFFENMTDRSRADATPPSSSATPARRASPRR